MGLFDGYRNKKTIDFNLVDSIEKAKNEVESGNLEAMYIVSPIFGGSLDEDNIIYVPIGIAKLKTKYDNAIEELLEKGEVQTFDCIPDYIGNSIVPSKITIKSSKDGDTVFQETIHIWQ